MKAKKSIRTIKFTTRLNASERKVLNRAAKTAKVTPSELVRRFVSTLA